MATHPDYPGASSRIKNGREQWRYRADRNAKQINLPGQPGGLDFEAAFTAAVQGGTKPVAKVVAMPGAASSKTFGAAYRLLLQTSEWQERDEATQINKERYLARFLDRRLTEGSTATWRDAPVAGVDFHRIDSLVAEIKRADGNNVAKRWLEVINDLLLVALRASPPWIPVLPTYGLKVRPIQSDGHKEWPREAREQFEAYHPIGSAARTCYELAYWFGNRRSDITRVGPQHIVTEEVENSDGEIRTVRAFSFRQKKTDEKVFHPILPWVAEALAPALARGTQTILATEKGQPFSDKALTMRMQVWTRQAGLPEGLTVHGLRKTLGNRLAELGLSARQIQEVLGHRTLAAAQVYVDKANKKMLALDSFAVLEQRETKRRLRIVK